MKTAFDKRNQSQGKLGEAIYASSQAAQSAPDAPAGDAGDAQGATDSDEDVVDAEVVDDEDEKK
ncbi:hypothetical protein D3C87_2193810 [compost metagenome]